ncbi:MAG TPA: LuxR C-terminal-related transcriptional regulator [Casimicrobiaceae bacterium]|jgi:transcriptional regulator of acetoin/glycerol metabolism/DNA-binding CsgD family transcriptional regulator|nr:LuxR C-terminal-related transcriptional regulator [Casimicrobiaceae bacterium]
MLRAAVRTPAEAAHPDRVYSVVENPNAIVPIEEVSTSWRRCLGELGVDPSSHDAPRILTTQELREIRAPVEELVASAQEELGRLHGIVGKVGYAVLLTSSGGVVVAYRGDPSRAVQFKHWGIWMGAIWAEHVEGTNGIGTCIAEQRPVTVHRTQHFRTRHTSLSCCGAPVFGPDGKLAAVLDVTSIDPDVSDRSHALALVVTIDSARAIEESLFRRHFRREWSLVIAPPSIIGRVSMLAVDDDQRIVGADCNARSMLGLDDSLLATGVSLWTIFNRSPLLFRRRNADAMAQLIRIGDNQPWRALITPPETRAATTNEALLHARSRIGHLDHILHEAPDSQLREVALGGRLRVDEFVKAHQAGAAAALSPRERYILELIGGGQSNKEIARLLGIAPETVKSHVKNLFVKLSVERRAQAVYRAQSLGMMATA